MSRLEITVTRFGESNKKASIQFVAHDVRYAFTTSSSPCGKDKVSSETSVHVPPEDLYELLGQIAASALAARDEVRRSEIQTYGRVRLLLAPHTRSDGAVVNVTIPEE